jgi:hypothetical protein
MTLTSVVRFMALMTLMTISVPFGISLSRHHYSRASALLNSFVKDLTSVSIGSNPASVDTTEVLLATHVFGGRFLGPAIRYILR